MSVSLESARRDWEEAHRRLGAASREPARYERLQAQVEAVTEALRRRIGETFTLGELASEYTEAERWSRPVVLERLPELGSPNDLSIVEGAAFYLYARGATDYTP